MTEELEQKAEEYVKNEWKSYKFYDAECDVYNDDIREDVKQAYIASAIENGIQWHKVSEELPNAEIGIHNVKTYRVLKLNAYKNPVECYCSYNNRTQKFEKVVDTGKGVWWKEIKGVFAWQEISPVPDEVKAWCEILPFEGE